MIDCQHMGSTIRDRPILQLVHHSASATPTFPGAARLIFIADEARHTTGANQTSATQAAWCDIISDRPVLRHLIPQTIDQLRRAEQQRQPEETYYCNLIFNFSNSAGSFRHCN